MSDQQKLFGGMDFINAMNVQADQFMSLVLESSILSDNARFCTVIAYKYDCEVDFRWGDKLDANSVRIHIGTSPTISIEGFLESRYPDGAIDELKNIADSLGWKFEK